MDLLLESLSCTSVVYEPSYFVDRDTNSFLEAMMFNDQTNPGFQLPSGFNQTSFTTSASEDSRVEDQFGSLPNQPIIYPNPQLVDAHAQGSSMIIEGILREKTAAEERIRRRREQNRASQRSYRQRKDKYIQRLERTNRSFQQQNLALVEENEQLRLQLSQFTGKLLTTGSVIHPNLSPPSSPATSSSPSSPAPMDQHGGESLNAKKDWNVLQGPWLNKCGQVTLEDSYRN
ncbi:hypothetical protein L207DRAFT_578658 [Hyaloscypha variabilis F]|uniref:BZIP domain-containing protein n=1 Tax=Hyaloscypha variabilis (strain UAMH 11265 / GT02V1 / F) TaxID=1149755 RepID=A0A2J6S4P8_HYAVF|nr:hypothetical protein L207DRAFT_578658 [Hyaloscypha variabilis F]